ncbi:hypothetical protein CXF80_16960 [Shewanella sp. Actino-trap-3]|jgi:hypothetical protein|uniref:hypothetical protein n=1 Tax=Shewanella sp. Actino-trap-3 TaxID=2058331 RepID=UPI000C3280E7|nr:hypothetical protein [Shewanella sp. Actino-trap-3]PKG79861.1 hypothetical protein CXF80_16960 [Shewanella sp. Actino-trap-3]
MADNVDEANEIADLHLAFELANAKPSLPPLTGRCFYCDTATTERFCDADCRDDYERDQRRTLMRKRG